MDDEKEILINEYNEAGQACRNNEGLVRTGISLFTAIQAAILGFIQTRNGISLEVILLEVLAIAVSVVTFLTVLRLQMLYTAYMERAKCIERRLGMNLYTYGWEFMQIETAPAQKIRNKRLLASIPVVVFLLFAILFIRDGRLYLASICG